MPTPKPVDGLVLLDDGRCELTIGSKLFAVRRPTFGEFRRFREAAQIADDKRLEAALPLQTEIDALAPGLTDADPGVRTAAMLAQRAITRKIDDAIQDDTIRWVTESLTVLAGDLPDADEWPPDVLVFSTITSLLNHWRNRPLGRGGPEGTTT